MKVHFNFKNTLVSSRKLASNSILDSLITSKKTDCNTTGYRYMDMEILSSIFSTLLCPECSLDNLELIEINFQEKGAASALTLICNCGYEKQLYTSPRVKNCTAFDINRRAVYSVQPCGVGYNGLELFSNLMDMSSAMASKAYDDTDKTLSDSCKKMQKNE